MSTQHQDIKDQLFANFARIGKALSSPKRLEIIDLLSQGERAVESLAAETALTVGNASAHLKVLHAARLVDRKRDGQRILYRLASPGVFRLLRELQHFAEERLAEVDRMVRLYYESPEALEPVSADELLRRVRGGEVVLVDVRPREEYLAGHLPGAVNIPPDELEVHLTDLPADREIVAYCRGPYCLYSVKAVTALRRAGYRASRLAAGLPDWRAEGHPVAVGAER
jgi:rhodanese-related sulfurtransferase/DNA-binding transcriptional ArsR family regulator